MTRTSERLHGFMTAVATAGLLAACTAEQSGTTPAGGESNGTAAPSPRGGSTAADAGGIRDMSSMHALGGGVTMAQMPAHLRMMRGASADSMKAMLPMHRQVVANMLAQMTGEMRDMHMPADAQWTATVDSLRHDLVQLPELTGAELKAMMPAHTGRVTRLMDLHRAMRGSTGQSGTGATSVRPGA